MRRRSIGYARRLARSRTGSRASSPRRPPVRRENEGHHWALSGTGRACVVVPRQEEPDSGARPDEPLLLMGPGQIERRSRHYTRHDAPSLFAAFAREIEATSRPISTCTRSWTTMPRAGPRRSVEGWPSPRLACPLHVHLGALAQPARAVLRRPDRKTNPLQRAPLDPPTGTRDPRLSRDRQRPSQTVQMDQVGSRPFRLHKALLLRNTQNRQHPGKDRQASESGR